MKRIVQILMKRDDMTQAEAEAWVADCKSEMEWLIAQGRYGEAEQVMEHELGLEPDYIFDLI